jgi:hypothetical protein
MLLILFAEREHFLRIEERFRFEAFCGLVSLVGLLVRCLTVGFVDDGTSGRNTKAQKADHLR